MASHSTLKKGQKHPQANVSGYMDTPRKTSRPRGMNPVASVPTRGGASATGKVLQSITAKPATSDSISVAGEDRESQHADLQGSGGPDSPNTKLGRVGPRTRSLGERDQPLKGATSASGNPAQTESSRRRKQPGRDLATRYPGELQLPEATEEPSVSQPSSSLRSHRSEASVQSQKFSESAFGSAATMSHQVSTRASKTRSQAVLPVSGGHKSAPEFSFDEGHATAAGQNLCQQATLQVPDPGLGQGESEVSPGSKGGVIVGGRVLRSRTTASGHHSSALEVSPGVRRTGQSLRPQADLQDPVGSATVGRRPDTTGNLATPRKGSRVSRPSSDRRYSGEAVEPASGPSSQTQGSLSTSPTEDPKSTETANCSSPPRRPVRMRASSPSPGRRYHLIRQFNGVLSSFPLFSDALDIPNSGSSSSSSPDQSPCASP
ncbi:EZH inhibitory protein-like [Arvicola amphibius]|uniref:EZH inhibitory protein-like n=1 Tax=Arvicola amphibius TaxID=1047088 RepID=UPI0018E3A13D|nr:EZH inhibitory protein-like [Arvicola amphibius]